MEFVKNNMHKCTVVPQLIKMPTLVTNKSNLLVSFYDTEIRNRLPMDVQ